jgi:hydrogenase-4 component E
MMMDLLNALLVIVLVLNLFALGTSRILSVIRIVAAQGVLLGVIPLLVHEHPALPALLASLVAVVLKGIVIPTIMTRALRDVLIKKEVTPLIGLLPSIILGAIATAFALLFSNRLQMAPGQGGTLIVPASFATILVGFILLTTRVKALTQAVGYLVLENGIFIFGLLLVDAIPLVVEMGVLLDLFVGIFVIAIIVKHINRAFSSTDTSRLVSLKE